MINSSESSIWSQLIGNASGKVRAFEYNLINEKWEQKGADIDGLDENFGYSLNLSSDGKRIVSGAIKNSEIEHQNGQIRVYDFDDEDWQLSAKFNGEGVWDQFGSSLDLTDDGLIIAGGSRRNSTNVDGDYSGHVKVYQEGTDSDETVWTQLGSEIVGEPGEQSGAAISISADGSIMAVGYHSWIKGQVKIYKYDLEDNSWDQIGNTISGDENNFDNLGFEGSISLSSDGSIIAVGNNRSSWQSELGGEVKIYKYNSTSNNWDQLGDDIDDNFIGNEFGSKVKLSNDGNTVAISKNDEKGLVKVFQYSPEEEIWSKIGSDLRGTRAGDNFGTSIDLSDDGSIIIVGSPGYDTSEPTWVMNSIGEIINTTQDNAGKVQIFQYDPITEIKSIPYFLIKVHR